MKAAGAGRFNSCNGGVAYTCYCSSSVALRDLACDPKDSMGNFVPFEFCPYFQHKGILRF